ncbi:MAG TPA: rod shape-determining protein MreC [Chakrabartia sp.]|nr:rod shape-determining protein MreC [Chakrabartia sp.]
MAGIIVSLLLVLSARFDPEGHSAIQSFFTDLFAPVSRTVRMGQAWLSGGGEEVAAYFDAASKNRAMASELERARSGLVKGAADAREVERLRKLLSLVEHEERVIVKARLVASTGSSSRRYALLGAGSAQGVEPGQTVISAQGLIGRVIQTGRSSARVQMIVDGGIRIPVQRVTDGMPALAVGIGDGRLLINPRAAGSNPFNVKDVFVTSGAGGVYKPGIPVAYAISKSRDGTFALPAAAPDRFDFAIVVPEFIAPLPPVPGELPRGEE